MLKTNITINVSIAFDISSTNIVASWTIKNIMKVVKAISVYVIPLRIDSK